jgi:hypothetical protein
VGYTRIQSTEFIDGTLKAKVCDQWLTDKFSTLLYTKIVSISINVINFVLRTFLILLVKFIGEDTKSEQTRSVKVAVFITQFFNTAILLLLFNANMSEQDVPLFSGALTGAYTDFNDDWYVDIGGTITKAMIVASIFPIIEFVMFGLMKWAFKFMDRSFTNDIFRSKKGSIQQYVDLEVGPEYMIHFRYSAILNTCFVCCMYGTGLPMLFPISLFAFLVLYFIERYCVCFYYKQPPMFDDAMTRNTLRILNWAPLVYMLMGLWMSGNRQIFGNHTYPIKHATDPAKSGHTIAQVFSNDEWDQSRPFFIIAMILLIGIPLGAVSAWILQCFGIGEVDINIDEDLANYYDAVEDEDRDEIIKDEENIRSEYHFKKLTDKTLVNFQQAKNVENSIQGVYNYDILSNPEYIQAF